MSVAGRSFRLDGSDFGLGRKIYGRRTYFPNGFAIKSVVVDLGANAGVLSALAAELGARVTAAEAQGHGFAASSRSPNGTEVERIEGVGGYLYATRLNGGQDSSLPRR